MGAVFTNINEAAQEIPLAIQQSACYNNKSVMRK